MSTEKVFCTCGHSFNSHRYGCEMYGCGCTQFKRDPNQVPYTGPDGIINHVATHGIPKDLREPEMLSLSKALDLLERAQKTGVFTGPGALALDDQILDFLKLHGRLV